MVSPSIVTASLTITRYVVDIDYVSEIRSHFLLFDKDGDGAITAKEIGTVLRQLNYRLTDSQITRMIQEVDKDGEQNSLFSPRIHLPRETKNIFERNFMSKIQKFAQITSALPG